MSAQENYKAVLNTQNEVLRSDFWRDLFCKLQSLVSQLTAKPVYCCAHLTCAVFWIKYENNNGAKPRHQGKNKQIHRNEWMCVTGKNPKKQNQNKNPNLVLEGSGNYDAQVLTSMYTS